MSSKPTPSDAMITIPVAAGELFDKITILEIKSEKITNSEQLANVKRELALLCAVRDTHTEGSSQLDALSNALKQVNLKLWQVEDDIREHEHGQRFGDSFVALARSVYQLNDERADLKRQISLLLGSGILEEKSYA